MNKLRVGQCLPLLVALSGAAFLQTAQAASLTLYGIGKVEKHVQSSDTAVALAADNAYAIRAIGVPAAGDSPTAFVQPPGNGVPIFLDTVGDILVGESIPYNTQSALDAANPAGAYGFSIVSTTTGAFDNATLNLGAVSYPNVPQISGFAAAQAIDATKPLVLTWNAFTGGTSGDAIQLTVLDDSGSVVFQTGLPGQANALDGTKTTVTIPANTLSSGINNATLDFIHVASRDTTSLAGATGITFFSEETSFTLTTTTSTGGGGGGGSGNPPVLLSSSPSNLAMNVPVDSPVVFTFSAAMAPVESIFWIFANYESNKFTYAWSADQTKLTCTYSGGFPASQSITWTLSPSGFKDTSGNALAQSQNIFGTFITASGGSGGNTNQTCQPGRTNGIGSFSVAKLLSYVQTSAAAPVLDPETKPFFVASLSSPTNDPVTQATLTLPNGTSRVLSNFFGSNFFFTDEFATQDALDAAYPAGTYKATLKRTSGRTDTANVSLGASTSYPPTPQVQNFDAATQWNTAADFTLQWLPFTGVTPNDFLFLSLRDPNGTSFNAPDECVPRPLANTATSIVVPKNTFSATPIDGSLSFEKVGTFDSNSVPNMVLFATLTKNTSFKFGQSTSSQPAFQNPSWTPTAGFHTQIKAAAGAIVTVEASTDLKTWTPVPAGVVPAAGLLDFTDPINVARPYRFYRASTP